MASDFLYLPFSICYVSGSREGDFLCHLKAILTKAEIQIVNDSFEYKQELSRACEAQRGSVSRDLMSDVSEFCES